MRETTSIALNAAVGAERSSSAPDTSWTPGRRPSAAKGGLGTFGRFLRSSLVGSASLALLLLIAGVAISADQLAPYNPLATDYAALGEAPSAEHALGTDLLGRDILSRLIHGARVTLAVGVFSVALGDGLGFVWGLLSGYVGRRFDVISQRLLDVLMAFPALILAMLLVVSLGPGLHTVIIAIAMTRVPLATRVIRSVVLSVKELAYVEAARTLGARPWRLIVRHLAPQCVAPLLVVASFNLGTAIFAEAALSFLGVGVPPPTPTWGSMLGGVLAEAFKPPWWLVVFPGLAITVTIISANLLGDALRDFLDPKMQGRLE
jgi:ABC-type dipeptide/oligopeptide/nickel transport system permease subunit